MHNEECTVSILKDETKKIRIDLRKDGTEAIIPAQPAWDLTYWEIKDKSQKKIEIEILVERVWWSLSDERHFSRSNDWSDTFLNLGKDYFKATSPYFVSIWLPKPNWINRFSVGFKKKLSKSIKVNVSQREAKIYLREFCDADEIVNKVEKKNFKLWIEIDSIVKELTIIKITELGKKPPPPPPPIDPDKDPCCNNCFHARVRLENYWCRRSHWPQQRSDEAFKQDIAHYKCGEWRGELDSDE